MKKKNYFEPTMKLHELKTGRVMAASIDQANTAPGGTKKGVEDFNEIDAWENN